VDCTFTYSNLSTQCSASSSTPSSSGQPKSTKVGFMDKLKNKAEKAKRNLGSLSKGENTYKRLDMLYSCFNQAEVVKIIFYSVSTYFVPYTDMLIASTALEIARTGSRIILLHSKPRLGSGKYNINLIRKYNYPILKFKLFISSN